MEKRCNICGRPFTRRWNLERHLDDVHYVNKKKYMVKRDIDNYYPLPKNNGYNNNFSNRVTNMKEMHHNQNFSNNNIFWDNFPPYEYNNTLQPYPYQYPYYPSFTDPNFNSQSKLEKEEWSLDDKIKMQKALKILQDNLGKRYHPIYIPQIIRYLNYRCVNEKSIKPLKQFFFQAFLGHIWPY